MFKKSNTTTQCKYCRYYGACEYMESEETCVDYEYYKCKDCIDRLVDHEDIVRCFMNGMMCSNIKYCNSSREAKDTTSMELSQRYSSDENSK